MDVKLKINQNPNFRTHNTSVRKNKIEYIVIHYVGETGDAKANMNYYNQKSSTSASADFFVGHTGDIWQYNPNPEARYCWAVGGNKIPNKGGAFYGIAKNANTIHIEMCVKNKGNKSVNSSDWYFTQETINATIELTKYLMEKYSIKADKVIRHFDVTGKACPGVVGWNASSGNESVWNGFKKKIGGTVVAPSTQATPSLPTAPFIVEVLVDNLNYRQGPSITNIAKGVTKKGKFTIVQTSNGWGKLKSGIGWIYLENSKYVKILKSKAPTGYVVQVTASALNIRSGPGTNYASAGTIRDKGKYTIVEEKNGFGKLKSGAGWISLQYTKKV